MSNACKDITRSYSAKLDLRIEKAFGKHLMERSGLLRYAEHGKVTRIVIDYDEDSGDGKMTVLSGYAMNQSESDDGASAMDPERESHS